MKKSVLLVLIAIVMLLGACGAFSDIDGTSDEPVALSKEIELSDGAFSISFPESWMRDYTVSEAEMIESGVILYYTDNQNSFANIYFLDKEVYTYPLNLAVQDSLDYYGDNIIGEYQEITLNNMDAFLIEYSMIDKSIDNVDFNYHGFEYLVDTPYGIIDIDVYYSQEVLESKIFKPSKQALELLQEIAESFKVH